MPASTVASSPTPTALPEVDAAAVRGPGTEYDFTPRPSVENAVAANPLVVTGTVLGWQEGRTIDVDPTSPNGDRSLSAVLRVQIDDSLGSTPLSGIAYVLVDRGSYTPALYDEKDRARYTFRDMDDLVRAVPAGVRVAVIGAPAIGDADIVSQEALATIVPAPGLPADAVMIQPEPQGLLFEDADGSYVSGVAPEQDVVVDTWPGGPASDQPQTFDALLAAMRAASTS